MWARPPLPLRAPTAREESPRWRLGLIHRPRRKLAPRPAVAPFDDKQAKVHQAAWAGYLGTPVQTANSIGMKLVLIPPGEFMMGSTPQQQAAARKFAEEGNLTPDQLILIEQEVPQHRVTLSKPCWLGMTEVTLGQFKQFVAATKVCHRSRAVGVWKLASVGAH